MILEDFMRDPEAMGAIQTLRAAGRRLGISPQELTRFVGDLIDPAVLAQKQRDAELARATSRMLELRAQQERADWGVPDPDPFPTRRLGR
jgi:hypothetical protein